MVCQNSVGPSRGTDAIAAIGQALDAVHGDYVESLDGYPSLYFLPLVTSALPCSIRSYLLLHPQAGLAYDDDILVNQVPCE